MIAFIMAVYCISGWGAQMFIVTLVFDNFSRERLVQYNKKCECPDQDKGTFRSLGTLLHKALIQG